MRPILAVLALLGIFTFAYAQQSPAPAVPAPTKKPQEFFILPPVEYDRNYEGDLTIKMVESVEELRDACGLTDPQILGCSIRTPTACLIILVPDYVMRKRSWTSGLILRHEIGHCNGWPGDHNGQRSVPGPGPYHVPANQRPIAKNVIPPMQRM